MAEYIDREAAYEDFEKCNSVDPKWTPGRVKVLIARQKTADVAPVVRCKDCKYYKESRVLAPNKFCFRLNHPTEPRKIGYNFGDDDFCSYGEQKDGGASDVRIAD